MKKINQLLNLAIMFFLSVNIASLASAAHYIVGYVNDARDGTPANGHNVVLWNPANGQNDNLTDTIGPTGNSGADNIYMIDCELLNTPCQVGDTLMVKVYNTGDNYISENASLTVTGAGYDVQNLTLNSPPIFESLSVDDNIYTPPQEIDLVAASTQRVFCRAILSDETENSIKNISARFFHEASSYSDADDNNYHYTNSSCFINKSYGDSQQVEAICSFDVWYYSNAGNWNCTMEAYDNLTTKSRYTNYTNVNELLSIGLVNAIEYGSVNTESVSDEITVNITNYGNTEVNLSLEGYAVSEGDGFAMTCTVNNISVGYEKYNLTISNPGQLSLSQFEQVYENLTSSEIVKDFSIPQRTNDVTDNSIKQTYWRIYNPQGTAGTCQGNIIFGARKSPGS